MVAPVTPSYLKWSQTAITFDQSDHPVHIATPGRQALVVDPVVEGTRLTKVLMDGGSGLNILYAEALKGMGIPMSKLSESNMRFHGIIPGKKAESLGQITLDAVFGDEKNFRKEKLTFEVVDFESAYHAILGRLAYARFRARPCYVHLKLKMLGPKGARANIAMVPKKDKSLRMCIDFKHINRSCPKDHFPLPRIDQIVDSTAGCERLSFLDAYSGYHQI